MASQVDVAATQLEAEGEAPAKRPRVLSRRDDSSASRASGPSTFSLASEWKSAFASGDEEEHEEELLGSQVEADVEANSKPRNKDKEPEERQLKEGAGPEDTQLQASPLEDTALEDSQPQGSREEHAEFDRSRFTRCTSRWELDSQL